LEFRSGQGNPSNPRVAAIDSGRAVLAWEADGGGGRVIRASVYNLGWGNAATVSSAPAANPDLAMGADGSAVLVWKRGPDATSTIWASYLGLGRGGSGGGQPGKAFKPRVVLAKRSAPIRGRVTLVVYVKPRSAAAGQQVRIDAKGKGGSWVILGRKTLNANGAYAGVLKGPRKPTVMFFRASIPGAKGYAGATSPVVRMRWRR
jgi:hypothetical protein